MTIYTACFRTDAQRANFDFAADSPDQALQLAHDLWMREPERLDFEAYDMAMLVNEIEISGPEGEKLAVWRDADLRLRLAAPELLAALNDQELDQAHDALSKLLEDEDAGNDDIRDAAITLCATLCDFAEKRRQTFVMAVESRS
jgi:hypothetical protein